jgi:uncharacterized protein YyaL (SSP411 family)
MITGLVHAFEALQDESILSQAIKTVDFIYKELYNSTTNTLYRCYCNGPSDIEAFLDDYSYLIQSLLDLYEVTFEEHYIEWAHALQEKQNDLFYDSELGGYFHVSSTDKSILIRMKEGNLCVFLYV